MSRITFPLNPGMRGPQVGDLQTALQLLLDRALILPNDPSARQQLSTVLLREHSTEHYGDATQRLVRAFQDENHIAPSGSVDERTANALNHLLDVLGGAVQPPPYLVKGTVRRIDGAPVADVSVSAFDRDLRSEQALGQSQTDRQGFYQIQYTTDQFSRAERGSADLVVKTLAAEGSLLAASDILFNAPPVAEVNITIPEKSLPALSLFEKIEEAQKPLLGVVKVEELEENQEHQDLSFLSGETGFDKQTLARFALAHRLAQQAIRAEFWFVILGGSFYQFAEDQSLEGQLGAVLDALPSLDAVAVRKAITRGFNEKEISDALRDKEADWIEAFLTFVADWTVSGSTPPSFVKLALEDAQITDLEKRKRFARLFNEHKVLNRELLDALEKDTSFTRAEIADLQTSFQLSDLA